MFGWLTSLSKRRCLDRGKVTCKAGVLVVLFLSGCSSHESPSPVGTPAAVGLFAPRPNVKVRWVRPEFLYTDATYLDDDPTDYSINPDGTLVPPFTRQDIGNMALMPGQFETYISGLTAAPDHRSVYFALSNGAGAISRAGRYRVGRHGLLALKQAFAWGYATYAPISMAFAGRGHFLYVMYIQSSSSRYMLLSYQVGAGGRVERLPVPPVVVATYTSPAIVSNPNPDDIAYAVTGPSNRFLCVVRALSQALDVYQIGPVETLSARPVASLPLSYRPGRAVFHPGGHVLYVADAEHASVTTYRIGPRGMPTPLRGAVPGTDPALDPQGRFLYAVSAGGRVLLCYRILPGGVLRALGATSAWAICAAPCVDATGRFLYALGHNPIRRDEAVISQFRITSGGMLAPLQPDQVPAVYSTTLISAQ